MCPFVPCSAEACIRRKSSPKCMWRIMVFDKSWNKETVRNRQLWLKSYLTLQPHPKPLCTTAAMWGHFGGTAIYERCAFSQAAAAQFPIAQRQELLPPSHITATGSATCILATFILLTTFLHFAYRIRDYLPFFCSFVNFINNNMSDSLQSQISFQPSQQHASRAVQKPGSWGLEG